MPLYNALLCHNILIFALNFISLFYGWGCGAVFDHPNYEPLKAFYYEYHSVN